MIVYDHNWSSTRNKAEDKNDDKSYFLQFKGLVENIGILPLWVLIKSDPPELLIMNEILIFLIVAFDCVF